MAGVEKSRFLFFVYHWQRHCQFREEIQGKGPWPLTSSPFIARSLTIYQVPSRLRSINSESPRHTYGRSWHETSVQDKNQESFIQVFLSSMVPWRSTVCQKCQAGSEGKLERVRIWSDSKPNHNTPKHPFHHWQRLTRSATRRAGLSKLLILPSFLTST